MEELPEIEAQWTNEGFNKMFEHFMKQNSDLPYTEAYRLTEEEHVKIFGKVRYKSYDSFRGTRHKMLFSDK